VPGFFSHLLQSKSFEKKKRKTAFFCSKSVDYYLYIGVCVFSVEFDQVENKKTVDEIEFSPIFFFRSLKDQITGFLFFF
jgi:hypothetical protein